MTNPSPNPWKAPLIAGATVVLSLLPVDMLYGVAVMATLGDAAAPLAVWSAFLPIILGSIFLARAAPGSALFGGLRPAQTLMVIALLVTVMQHATLGEGGLPVALAAMALAVGSSGFFQWLIGVLRLGRVIKFIPLPVLSGITNGSAVALTWMALKDVLGVDALNAAWTLLFQGDAGAGLRILLLVALLALMHQAARRGWRLHWSLVGVLVGTVLFQSLPLLLPSLAQYWPVLGGALPAVPELDIRPQGLMGLGALTTLEAWTELLRLSLPVGLAVAAISSIETLITLAYVETLNGQRLEPNRVLRGLGMANLISGLFGGLPMSPSNGRVLVGYQAGARNWRSPLVASVTAILLIVLLPLVVHVIPRLAASAVMVYLAWTLVDSWTKRNVVLLAKPATPATLRRDLILMLFVTVMIIAIGMMPAIALGLLVAMALFVVNNSSSVIAAIHRGSHRHSLVVRTPEEEAILQPLRERIMLIEFTGSLFFGTADAMREAVEVMLKPGDVLILSLRRIVEIDFSGASALASMTKGLQGLDSPVFLCDVPSLKPAARVQLLSALRGIVSPRQMLPDADRALQAAEDYLLADVGHGSAHLQLEKSLAQSELLRGFGSDDIALLKPFFSRLHYAGDEVIFSAGQMADAMYLLARGEVEILLADVGNGDKRLGLFRAGVVFGEMGLLQAGARSADAIARSDVIMLSLTADALARLQHAHPELAFKLMHNIARQMASRLSIANTELRFALQI